MQVQIAAAAAAAAAVPPKGQHVPMGINDLDLIDPSAFVDPNDITSSNIINNNNNTGEIPKTVGGKRATTKRGASNADLTPEEKKKLNRDRNRQHARSTRLRKKAYIEKLKQLVDGLHAERSEQDRKRRVEVQHLAEMHKVRRTVIKNFLRFHSGNITDAKKWSTLLEEDFFLKQPVTPYRSFRCGEIEMSSERECRRSKGIEAMIGDAASMAIMVESVGSRSARWMQIKREEFLTQEEAKTGTMRRLPCTIQGQTAGSRLQPAVSSLSSSSRASSGNGSSSEEDRRQKQEVLVSTTRKPSSGGEVTEGENMGKNQPTICESNAKQVSSSSDGSSGGNNNNNNRQQISNNDYHDYHAQPLPDPKLDSGGSSAGSTNGSDSPANGSDIAVAGKHVCTDSSSGDEERSSHPHTKKRRLNSMEPSVEINTGSGPLSSTNPSTATPLQTSEDSRNLEPNTLGQTPVSDPIVGSTTSTIVEPAGKRPNLPANIARSGGISHNIRPVTEGSVNSRLSSAPIVPLPPFVGIGKRAITAIGTANSGVTTTTNIVKNPGVRMIPKTTHPAVSSSNGSELAQAITSTFPPHNISPSKVKGESDNSKGREIVPSTRNVTSLIGAYNDNCSEDSSLPQIQAYYHINEDDMLLTDDVLMCPFIFRTQDAVLCGALAECVMPGMLRAQFSDRNKLTSLEMVYDAMGFMQQLERASGNEGTAQIIPNSLEMALQPTNDARVITMAQPPFRIVSVNETWAETTKYTQMEVEGKQLSLLNGPRTDNELKMRQGKYPQDMTEVAKGRPTCGVNVYYDKNGANFIAFVSSFPLATPEDKVTHILHTFKKLPEATTVEFANAS